MLLDIHNITKVYQKGKSRVKANDNISFPLDKEEILGILGPNGAGKTTLIKQIATLLTPDEGEILYRGASLVKHPEIIRGRFSFLLEGMQNVYHYLTGEANLLYFAYLNKIPTLVAKKRSHYLLKKMDLYNVKDRYVFTYSSGMKKKLAIATCLINEPEIVFLDEPLSGLDVVAAEELTELIKDQVDKSQKTFIVASHRMEFIERVTSRVLWMKEGKIVIDGNTENVKNMCNAREFVIYLRNSIETQRKLLQAKIQFQELSNSMLKVHLSFPSQKKLFSFLVSNFEFINIEKKDSDFEMIFKELYHVKSN